MVSGKEEMTELSDTASQHESSPSAEAPPNHPFSKAAGKGQGCGVTEEERALPALIRDGLEAISSRSPEHATFLLVRRGTFRLEDEVRIPRLQEHLYTRTKCRVWVPVVSDALVHTVGQAVARRVDGHRYVGAGFINTVAHDAIELTARESRVVGVGWTGR